MALSLSTLKSLSLDLQSKLFYFYKSDSFGLQLRNPLPLKFKYLSLWKRKFQNGTKAQGQAEHSICHEIHGCLNFV